MADYWIWWVLAAVLVGAELVTGTFYLLAMAIAFAVGGLCAALGVTLPWQLVVAAVVAVVATMVAHHWRESRGAAPRQMSLDLGQSVKVLDWREDGTARVFYRGTQWDAEPAAPDAARAETMYIVGTRGSTLLIADRRPS